ncbi:patatin-like phospholipase family protein [Rhizobium sp. LjRoot98]|uniref:patatin-like phospholipase family protein n=1 Tax=Rhizobium sp. LjRoot98 TaxID=3342345 RepID=UPI003ECCCEC0
MTSIGASPEVWLCLSGGNALGAYHAGAYTALHAAGIRPKRIAGTSVGAIVAALIAGNRPEDRVARLDEFWRLAASDVAIANFVRFWDGSKIASSLGTLLHGRPGLFQPSLGLWWRRLSGLPSPSLFERSGMRATLRRLVDFDYLNGGDIRLIVNATDVTTGEEQVYDTGEMEVTVDHLMASSAFPVLFQPEPVSDRLMVDGGLVANLPILPLFRDPPACPVNCLAFDLIQANGPLPKTLDDAAHRMQDLLLSNQSRRSVELLEHRSSGWPVFRR